jgi:hypothetical protein
LRKADVADSIVHESVEADARIEARARRGRQGNAHNLGSKPLQPERQPSALEAGMPREQHAPAMQRIPQGLFEGCGHVGAQVLA